jgi:threonine synthase
VAKISFLECTKCGEHISADTPQTICPKDGGSLYVRYDFSPYLGKLKATDLSNRTGSMWRYREVLPDVPPVTLGEGATPMIQSRTNPNVYIKDEGMNPTGSFKARGLSAAVTMCKHYGLKKLAIPSAGNAASALAAYAAAAGIEAHIFMPKDVPQANFIECTMYGAKVTLVDGLISDCGKLVRDGAKENGWFEIATLKEPFRVEGKKTMGYELSEQLGWTLPDAIFYPTGGGVGLIGMWKAFDEMQQFGWIGSERPKMIAVQAEGCEPITKAWNEHKPVSDFYENAHTIAAGLRVPKAYADYIVLDIVKRSGGTALSVSDSELIAAVRECATNDGVFMAPEGAASWVAYQKLITSGFLKKSDRVVLFNTGSGLKYIDVFQNALKPS